LVFPCERKGVLIELKEVSLYECGQGEDQGSCETPA